MAEPPPARVLFDRVPQRFERRVLAIEPGVEVPFVAADWRDAIVLVQGGALELDCQAGGCRRFEAGAVLCLDGLALRLLRNPGPAAIRVVAVSRRAEAPP
jgi:hypothetical protein